VVCGRPLHGGDGGHLHPERARHPAAAARVVELGRARHAPGVRRGGRLPRQRHQHGAALPVARAHDVHEPVVLHVVEVGRPHLLRQRAAPAAEPLGAVAHGGAAAPPPAAPARELVALPHLGPPEAAIEEAAEAQEHAHGHHRVADVVVVDVQRRHAEDEERRDAEQDEGEGVHVHVAEPEALHVPPEYAERARRRQRAHRAVVAAVEQPAAPLRAAHHHAAVVHLDLQVLLAVVPGPVALLLPRFGRRRRLRVGLVGLLPSQRAVRRVESGDDRTPRAEAVADVERPVRAVLARVAPEQGAAVVLGEAGDVEQGHHDEHVRAVARARGAVPAVHLPDLLAVAVGAPPEEQHQVVEDLGVLVQAHDGEERVQDLVDHLRPLLAPLVVGDGGVEHAGHEHEPQKQTGGDERQPDDHREVLGLPAPARRVAPQLAPLDLPHERHAEPPPRAAAPAAVAILGCSPQRRLVVPAAEAADEGGAEEPVLGRVGAEEVQEPPPAPALVERAPLHGWDVDVDGDEVHQPHCPRRLAGLASDLDDLVPVVEAAIRRHLRQTPLPNSTASLQNMMSYLQLQQVIQNTADN
jgi:hypothetical protein